MYRPGGRRRTQSTRKTYRYEIARVGVALECRECRRIEVCDEADALPGAAGANRLVVPAENYRSPACIEAGSALRRASRFVSQSGSISGTDDSSNSV